MELNRIQAMSAMSLAINSRFDTSGYSEYARKFGYGAEALMEVMLNTAQNKTYSKVIGSKAEGTDFLFSDVDILMIDQCSTVGYNPQEATNSDKVYLLLTSEPSTRAGYTKLQIYQSGKPIKIDFKKSFQQYDHHFVQINKGKCFLTNIIIMPLLRIIANDKPISTGKHGPAATSKFSKLPVDSVPAYESQNIPREMMSWFGRHRPYNWPSIETCHLFKSMGCCYVGVGHLQSQERLLEWRISPTRQELYLMLNLNPTQYRCYIALKVIKKEFVEKVCRDMLSSYHCKTALFYTIETTNPDIWQPNNLIKCVLNCLKLLLDWVKKRNCPNYFIPEENMFETKLIDNYNIEKLQVTLDKLICNYLGTYLKLMNCWNVFKPDKNLLGRATELKMILRNVNYDFITDCSLSEQRNKIMEICDKAKCATEQNKLEEIKMLCPFKLDYGLLVEVLEKRLLHLKRFEHLLSIMRRKMKVKHYFDMHKDITEALPEDFQYCLKLASIASAQTDYAICDELLQKAKHEAYRASVICGCDFTYLVADTSFWMVGKTTDVCDQKLTSAGKCLNSMSINQIMQQFTMCLSFIYTELEGGILMAPLHLEAYKTVRKSQSKKVVSERNDILEDLMSIHPVTYMYFLQYKNSDMMENKSDTCVALEKLENMNLVSLQKLIYSHPDIILNLLGHIYITKGWNRLAIRCFIRSWQLLPDINSAKWHIMFLLFRSTKQASKRLFKKKKVKQR